MRIAMIGSGYVGLVSGACFADFGHQVTCVDKDAALIAALERLEMPIFEPGLPELVATNVRSGRLSFTTDLSRPVADADVVFIAVGTPSRRGDGYADLTHVYAAAREIARELVGFTAIVVKSTVPVGTCDEVERIVREARPDVDAVVVSNPEFLREGAAIADFKQPDRVVVGTADDRAVETMTEVYRPLQINRTTLLVTGRRTSELIKYAANAFLAMKVSFVNEMADICELVGADVHDLANGIGLDRRIGPDFLQAGPGYGGSCFPKDMRALLKIAQDAGAHARLVEATISVNESRKRSQARKIINALGGKVHNRRIAILGLTFKPDTDDVRESPALTIIPALQDAGAVVVAHDPEGIEQARPHLTDVDFLADPYECAAGAEALVILTEWDSFRALDFRRLKSIMKSPLLVDLRNVYRGQEIARQGFRYVCVGRPDKGGEPAFDAAAE